MLTRFSSIILTSPEEKTVLKHKKRFHWSNSNEKYTVYQIAVKPLSHSFRQWLQIEIYTRGIDIQRCSLCSWSHDPHSQPHFVPQHLIYDTGNCEHPANTPCVSSAFDRVEYFLVKKAARGPFLDGSWVRGFSLWQTGLLHKLRKAELASSC